MNSYKHLICFNDLCCSSYDKYTLRDYLHELLFRYAYRKTRTKTMDLMKLDNDINTNTFYNIDELDELYSESYGFHHE